MTEEFEAGNVTEVLDSVDASYGKTSHTVTVGVVGADPPPKKMRTSQLPSDTG